MFIFKDNINTVRACNVKTRGFERQQSISIDSPTKTITPEATETTIHNPLIACSAGLLTLALQIRNTLDYSEPAQLREGLIRQVQAFETCARAQGVPVPVVLPARYALCAMLDEAVLVTPWGVRSDWGEQRLLQHFFQEVTSGERFFVTLEGLLVHPSNHRILLELFGLCLTLGFVGFEQANLAEQARRTELRQRALQTILELRHAYKPALSPQWQILKKTRARWLPWWVLIILIILCLVALFAGFTFKLNRKSDQILYELVVLDAHLPAQSDKILAARQINIVAPNLTELTSDSARIPPDFVSPELATIKATPVVSASNLCTVLADEIAHEKIELHERPQGTAILLKGQDLFPAGSSTLNPDFLSLLQKIAQVLNNLSDEILITGHTDSSPIHNLRFPSNWHLSQARAEKIRAIFIATIGHPERFQAEGRADAELLEPEHPRAASNRRIEIILLASKSPHQIKPHASSTLAQLFL